MNQLTSVDLVNAISALSTRRTYDYYTGNTKIKIIAIEGTEGPIKFQRWNKNSDIRNPSIGSLTVNQLSTVASVFSRRPNYPIHFDRLFSGGGNSRSALETVLALTPNFFICYPQKSNPYTGRIEEDLKHIMWCPDGVHPLGEMKEKSFKQIISEIELNVDYGDMSLLLDSLGQEINSIEAKMHAQMQVACVRIGAALKFQTWIAKNDQTIKVGKSKLGDLQGVLKSLDEVQILYSLESKRAASLIDCIWFSQDFKYIPAVIEIEHSTGVTSGLTRMLKFKETIPSIDMTFTVIAPDELRNKVVSEANNPVFNSMKTRYMPYSAVRELYGLIQKYNLSNVVQRSFIEPFMEKIVE